MANLLQKASIVLTPTAYDNGKVLCAKPSEAPYGDFDFSRNSAATRVNAQGLVENVQILSSNLVQNGDFSEEGVQEVSNGSFSQEGVEEVTNGSFDTDSDWNKGAGWSISGGKAICDGTNSVYLYQSLAGTTTNDVFKITYTISNYISGSVAVGFGSGLNQPLGTQRNADGTYTEYLTKSSTSTSFGFKSASFKGSIDNVSVREVGQDWTIENTWTIGDGVANGNGAVGSTEELIQNNTFTLGKTYKVVYEILNYVSGSIRFQFAGGATLSGTTRSSDGTFTEYVEATANHSLLKFKAGSPFNGSITNISVKEVLQDWSVEDYGAVSPSAVITPNTEGVKLEKTVSADWRSSFLVQPISYTNGSQYKVTFKLKNGNLPSGGSVFVRASYQSSVQNIASTLTLTNDWVEYTYYFVAGVGSTDISFGDVNWQNAGVGQYFYIDDVSVIEITDDTNLPRINYEGFSYQDALGSEQVVNGDFSDGSANWYVPNGGWSVSNNTLIHDGSTTSATGLQNINIDGDVGTIYKLTLNVISATNADLRFYSPNVGYISQIVNTGDTLTYLLESNGSYSTLAARNYSGAEIILDNISVKEYSGQEVVPNSGCGSWLFEPQSTNLIEYSNDYSQWQLIGGGSLVSNSVISPDGTQNASSWITDTTGQKIQKPTAGFINGNEYTFSVYIKADANMNVGIGGIESPTISVAVTNEWQRFEITQNASNTTRYPQLQNIGDNGTFYIWGAQVEEQSYATSYIPTSGSTVTRNQDVCNNGGSLATINSTEGVLYAEMIGLGTTGSTQTIGMFSDNVTSRVLFRRSPSANRIQALVYVNSIIQFNVSSPSIQNGFNKVALKYKENDFALWINGTEIATGNSGLTPSIPLSKVSFKDEAVDNPFFGKTKALAVWKEALSDQELADLTYPTPTDPTFSLDFDTIAEQFTFTRGSEATYVDAQGLIQSTNEIGEELVVNGDFATDSDWNKVNATISDGKGNLDSTSGTSLLYQSALVVGKSYKATLEVSNYNGLGTCALINSSGATQFAITSDGNKDFYFTHGGTNANLSFRATNGGIFSIDNVSVKEVTTATNTPRLDYSTGAEAFLLEPQSTNLIPYSDDFSNSAWIKQTNITVLDNQIISPDGTLNSDKITTSSSSNFMYDVLSLTPLTEYTVSFYLKNDNAVRTSFWGAGQNNVDITWSGKNIQSISGAASYEYFGNDWYKVSVTQQSTSNGSYVIRFYPNTTSTTVNSIYLWGFQVEEQSYATSYIPTNGSQTTRNQETCLNATPEINSEEGVLYAEISALANDGTIRYIYISDGTNDNGVRLYYTTINNRITARYYVNGTATSVLNFTLPNVLDFNKIAFRYRENDFSLWANGFKVADDTLGATNLPNTLTNLSFATGIGGSPFFGNTKDLKYYPKALSDAELIKLTT